MTTFVQNGGGTLVAQFYEYAGGPLVDLDAAHNITITAIDGGAVAVGPTSVGVLHPVLGTYTYPWLAPVDPGNYLALWEGTLLGEDVQASEMFTVTYAASDDTAGPCSAWTPVWCVDLPLSTSAVSGVALQAATEILWAKSGRQFDECTMTLRPCRRDCWGQANFPWFRSWNEYGARWPFPYNFNGQWFNLGCGGCPGSCSCTVLYTALLPDPTSSVTQVKVDGEVLSPTAYEVWDHRILMRRDGSDWPICNNLNLDDTEVGTWSVTITVGTPVPVLGRMAVAELTRELALACIGDPSGQRPRPVQQVVRQGVSSTFLDPNEVFADGRIGLTRSDFFISTFNPSGIAARAQAIDVDKAYAPWRRTWPS